jgi:hypothetical protein
MTYLPVVPNADFQKLFEISLAREVIWKFIQEQDIRRPMQNLERKTMEMAEHTVYSPDGSNWPREFISPL